MVIDPTPVDRAVRELYALTSPDGRTHPASVIVGVRRAGETVVRALGDATPGSATSDPQPATPDTAADLASVTKVAATTTLVMMLTSRGELALHDPVRRFLPRYAAADTTLSDLLTHSAGLTPWWPYYFDCRTPEDVFDHLLTVEPTAPPHKGRVYSDLGFMLLGKIVAQAAGSGLEAVFHDMLAAPLGLRSAGYRPPEAAACAVSSIGDWYERTMIATRSPYPVPFTTAQFPRWRTGPLQGTPNDGNAAHVFNGVSGHAGLFASMPDLLRLGAAIRERQVADDATLATFLAPSQVDATQASGFRLHTLKSAGQTHRIAYHTGFTGTFFAFDPETDFVMAIACMRLYRTSEWDLHVNPARQVVRGDDITRLAWKLAEDVLTSPDRGGSDE